MAAIGTDGPPHRRFPFRTAHLLTFPVNRKVLQSVSSHRALVPARVRASRTSQRDGVGPEAHHVEQAIVAILPSPLCLQIIFTRSAFAIPLPSNLRYRQMSCQFSGSDQVSFT